MLGIRAAALRLVALALGGASTEALGGAWTHEAGHGQLLVTATGSGADRVFDGSRNLQPMPRYSKFEFQALFEYGMTDWFTAIISPGLQHIDIASPTSASRTGLGYTEFGGRYRFIQGQNWVISGQATLRVPGTFDQSNPAAIGYNGIETDLRALFGYSFAIGAWPAFLDLQFAQRFRSGDPPDEFRADVTFGLRPLPHWLFLTQFFNVISEGSNAPLFPSYHYSKLQLSAVYDLTRQWSLQAGGYATYSGRNALQENGLLAGAWYRF